MIVDAPGARDEDIQVCFTHGTLAVKISRQRITERDIGKFHQEERCFAEKRRVIKVPDNIDTDHAHAELKNGILNITLPKLHQSPGRNIQVKKW